MADNNKAAPLDKAKTDVLDEVAKFVVDKGMSPAAVLFLESSRPLLRLGSQAFLFFEPFINILFTSKKISLFRESFEEEKYVDYFIEKLEEKDQEKKTTKMPPDKIRTDLHIHSTASDGTFSPKQLISNLKRTGISLFAVTDHDSVANVLETEALAKKEKLSFIRGVEITSRYKNLLLHIVSYGINLTDNNLLAILRENASHFEESSLRALRFLIEKGHKLDFAEYEKYTYKPGRGGWKFLNYLIDHNVCKDVSDFFARLFKDHHEIIVPEVCHPEKVIKTVLNCKGIPILAHPGESLKRLSLPEREETLYYLLGLGVQGLECYSTYHTEESTCYYLDFCKKNKLLITGGSDCHGSFTPGRVLGYPEVYLSQLTLGKILP